ncbi:MAG: calcium-binding protein, partial [Desulfuromonadaceae bacterium]|nr:calcium-binding protein [Desulfuromonadaceae bacterium]
SEYTVDMSGQIDGTTTTINYESGDGTYNFVGGNNSWAGFNDADPTNGSQDLLLTPAMGGSVNSNNNAAGIDNASIGSGEGMRLDFVVDLSGIPDKGDYNDLLQPSHEFDGHYEVNGASIKVGSVKSATNIRFLAKYDYDSDNSETLVDESFIVGDGDPVIINGVVIKYNDQTASFFEDTTEALVGGHTFTVDFNDTTGEVVVGSVVSDATISIFGVENYNSLEFYYESGSTFDIRNFSTLSFNEVENPLEINLPGALEITDGDGDISYGNFDMLLLPEGTTFDSDHTISGTSGNDELLGTTGNDLIFGGDGLDSLVGNDGDDLLFGGEGDDTLDGSTGNDLLFGGAGNDLLSGGTGLDDFLFNAGANEGHDTIDDFSLTDDTLGFYDVLDADGPDANTINDYLDNITITLGGVNNADVTLLSTTNGTQITLEGVNNLGVFDGYNNLGDFLTDNPTAIKVDINPDHFAT